MLVLTFSASVEGDEGQEAFAAFDLNGSGELDSKELEKAMRSLGGPVTLGAARDALAEFDEDFSGALSDQEFSFCWMPSNSQILILESVVCKSAGYACLDRVIRL